MRNYALTGRASRSAIAAGANPASARTRAYRWLQKAEIQDRIQELRQESFSELRHDVSETLCRSVKAGLENPRSYREARRAIALMNRLGVFEYINAAERAGAK